MTATSARLDPAAQYLVRAAVTAPSPYNSQPWRFISRDGELQLHADPTRRLSATDPDGREMLIGCGAALFNVRLAMRHLGFVPRLSIIPDPALPWLLATVRWGPYAPPTAAEEAMFAALPQRRTHRGPFRPAPLPLTLIEQLREHARREGAELSTTLTHPEDLRRLAGLIRAAESLRRVHPVLTTELAKWAPPRGSRRRDGIPAGAYPRSPDTTAFAGRDYAGHARTGCEQERTWRTAHPTLGLVVLLTTRHDLRDDWLRAGQSLQRVLLHATAHHVAAAVHTQPLELPELRERVRGMVIGGQYPQMILRIGHDNNAHAARTSPRRPVADVMGTCE
ncbi:Acg family FMN-binding oxidoreductase [Streptomyces sp. NPDC050548]|uniref:Acg family FMN-binding oxidoreductase n=1 Tax=Streptomyces sp. NPDC050548 TaxID=3365629 RepID=UPI00378D5966